MTYSRHLAIVAMTLFLVCTNAQADSLASIFSAGSEWELYVDGWQGTAVIDSKTRTARNPSSGNITRTVTFTWKGKTGKMTINEDASTGQRKVSLDVVTPDGLAVSATGNVSDYVVKVTAGTTTSNVDGKETYGAWYAKRTQAGKTASSNTSSSSTFGSADKKATVAPVAQARCTLTGQVSGQLADVQGVWVKDSSGNSSVEQLRSGGEFTASVAAGQVQVTVVAKGKLDLSGSGLSQTVDCPPGGGKSIAANVTGVTH